MPHYWALLTFSVTASSQTTLTYQWFRNSVAIAGANSSSYSELFDSFGKRDSKYSASKVHQCRSFGVISSNACLNFGSSSVHHNSAPVARGVARDKMFPLSVVASSTQPLSYQWYFWRCRIGLPQYRRHP